MPLAPTPHGAGQAGARGRWGRWGRLEGPVPFRIPTSVRTVLDYVRGTRHRPKCWIEPSPMLDGTSSGKEDFIAPFVPRDSEASASRKANE